jgi:exonuclease III
MKIVDFIKRELEPGDVICLQEIKNHDFTVVEIKDNALSTKPGELPVVTVQLQCNLFMQFPNRGQAGVALPAYLVMKAQKPQGSA